MEIKEIFSRNLKWSLKISERKQAWLARRVGVSTAVVCEWCQGRKLPALETLVKICEVLDVRADYLMGLSDTNYPMIIYWKGYPVYKDVEINEEDYSVNQNNAMFDLNYLEALSKLNPNTGGGQDFCPEEE